MKIATDLLLDSASWSPLAPRRHHLTNYDLLKNTARAVFREYVVRAGRVRMAEFEEGNRVEVKKFIPRIESWHVIQNDQNMQELLSNLSNMQEYYR